METIVSYVLSGGVGSRLLPYSTAELPKQYLKIFGGETLLGETIRRLADGRGDPVHIVASQADIAHLESYRQRVFETGGQMLLEPIRRNTAMAVAVATAHAWKNDPEGLMLVTPADHQVESAPAFWEAVEAGRAAARDGRLVLIGIRPTRPETGFGYIEIADGNSGSRVVDVCRFREKPDLLDATRFVRSGRHFWNSGVFLFRPDAVRDWFLDWSPHVWRAAERALSTARRQEGRIELDSSAYEAVESIQFDTEIVERAPRVSMVRGEFGWRDLGSWRSLVEATVTPWRAAQ